MTDNLNLLNAIKAIVYSWMKEAAAEALKEHSAQDVPVYPEKVGIQLASEITGYSKNSLCQMHSRGIIPGAVKVGGKLLFDSATLRKWVEEGGRQY